MARCASVMGTICGQLDRRPGMRCISMGELGYHATPPGVGQTGEHTVLKFNKASRMEDEADGTEYCDPCLKQCSCSRTVWKWRHPASLNFCEVGLSKQSGCTVLLGTLLSWGVRPFYEPCCRWALVGFGRQRCVALSQRTNERQDLRLPFLPLVAVRKAEANR